MKKDVIVSIKGLQYSMENSGDDDQRIETLNRGTYAFRNSHHMLAYDECLDENTMVKSLVKFNNEFFEVTKKGPYSVHMLFEQGKKNLTSYSTPFGELLVGIDTKELVIEQSEEEISVYISYKMEINYEFLADSEIEVHIQSV